MALTLFPDITDRQVIIVDICQLVPSFLSLVSCCVSLGVFTMIPRAEIKLRHEMIRLLILSDLLRAILQFIFPWFGIHAIITGHENSKFLVQDMFPFCDFVGFMINYSFDLNDLIMLVMATHTLLLILRPTSVITSQLNNREGGLSPYRLPIIVTIVLVPVVLNSLVFIDSSFTNFVSFCYIPIRPMYIRIVSSWGLRFFTLLFIFLTYLVIYAYIYYRYTELKKLQRLQEYSSQFFSMPHLRFLYHRRNSSKTLNSPTENRVEMRFRNEYEAEADEVPEEQDEARILKEDLLRSNIVEFNNRRIQIFKNLRFIFIYPVAYLCVWFVPLLTQCYRYSMKKTPFQLYCVVVWFQLFDGIIQSCIFFIREKPWSLVQENKMQDDLDLTVSQDPISKSSPGSRQPDGPKSVDSNDEIPLSEFLQL